MKKILNLGAMLLFCISALCQVPVQVNEKMFVGFQREDGVFVIYDAKGLVTVKEGKFAVRLETTELKLSKFLAVTDFYNTLDEARAKLGLNPITFPSIVENPRVEELKPKVEELKPKVEELNPKVEELKPKVEELKPKGYSWAIGQVGTHYGSRYETELGEIRQGVSTFRFMGQNVTYPEFDSKLQSTENLSIIDLPTHSIINFAGTDFVSAIEMKLTDENGKEVWYLYDTRGGYHPCINRIDCNSKLRGNNHPDDATRWIKNGKYTLWVKNHSTDRRAIQRITFDTTTSVKFFESDLEPGHEQTFELNITRLSEGDYKINCNVFTPR